MTQKKGILGSLGGLIGNVPGPGRAPALAPADPPAAALITVPVEQIDLCDLNPREQPNKAFQKIKESIQSSGLDNPIPITRRPGSDRFMVAGGGNTRLRALLELAREEAAAQRPGEPPRFAAAPCVFKPYTSDIDILAAHLRENDLRDDLVFIDHALALQTLKELLEQTRGTLGKTDYEKILRDEMGHPVSRRDLGRMDYAVSVLWPAIPNVFRSGAGPTFVDEIGKLSTAYENVYKKILESAPDIESPARFDDLFADELGLHDEEDGGRFPFEAFQAGLDRRIEETTGHKPNVVRLKVEHQLMQRTHILPADEPVIKTSRPAEEPFPAPAAAPPTAHAAPGPASPGQPAHAAMQATPFPEAPAEEAVSGPADEGLGRESAAPAEAFAGGGSAPFPWPAPTEAQAEASEAVPAAFSPSAFVFADIPATRPRQAAEPPAPPQEPHASTQDARLPAAPPSPILPGQIARQAAHLARKAGVEWLSATADPSAPGGFRLAPLRAGADKRETAVWWLLAALSGVADTETAPPNPVAMFQQILTKLDGGRPPSDETLQLLSGLLGLVASLARLRDGQGASPLTTTNNGTAG